MQWLAVALGGAAGAMGRYALTLWLFPVTGARFPLGTFVANLLGCTLVGVAFVLIVDKGLVPPSYRPLVIVGGLGALTTFSTFSLDTLLLWHNGAPWVAVLYALATLLGCLIATVLAFYGTRALF